MPQVEQRAPSPMQVVAERIRTGSKRGERGDPWKVLLLVEGGGMAGVITAEMLAALAKRDPHLDSIDAAGANSAGLLNLAYALSDEGDGYEIEQGRAIYPMLTDSRFYDPRRLSNCIRQRDNQPPVINMDYLIYDVMGRMVPLNWENVLKHDLPTTAYVTNTHDASVRPVDMSSHSSQEELLKTLDLTSSIPFYADAGGHPHPDGTDGGVGSRGVSIREALAQHPDVTHVLALLNKPEGAVIQNTDPLKSFAGVMLRRFGYEDLAHAMETWNRGNRANEKFMESQRPAEPSSGNPIIQTVRVPRGRPQIGIMEQNIRKIRSEAPYGQAAIDAKLSRLLPTSGLIYES